MLWADEEGPVVSLEQHVSNLTVVLGACTTYLSSPPDMKLSPPLAYSAMYSLSLLDGLMETGTACGIFSEDRPKSDKKSLMSVEREKVLCNSQDDRRLLL